MPETARRLLGTSQREASGRPSSRESRPCSSDSIPPYCVGCADLRPDVFMDLRGPWRQYWTMFVVVQHMAARGCASCIVLETALTKLAGPLPDGEIMKIFISHESRPTKGPLEITLGPYNIELYALPESRTRWDAIGWEERQHIFPDSSSDECMNQVRTWLEDCAQSHDDCRTSTFKLPKRLIHVGSSNAEPRLHISNGEEARYTTLSHRWAKVQPIITEEATLSQRMHQIPFQDFPKQFKDAITLTRNLGIEYLWIDSLCIIQDNRQDWEEQAGEMANIYSNAYVSISADDAKDCSEGFLGPRSKNAYNHISIPCPGFHDGDSVDIYARVRILFNHPKGQQANRIFSSIGHSEDEDPPPRILDTRGWTFQERLLSPRSLHYTASEMVFECREHLRCECSRVYDEIQNYPKAYLFKNQGYRTQGTMGFSWQHIVRSFTERELTFERDRLFAIAGAAATMKYGPENYCLGLWRQEITPSLAWEVLDASSSRRIQGDYAPTWTWASVTGPIGMISYPEDMTEEERDNTGFCSIVDVHVECSGVNPYGPGQGFVVRHAPLGSAVIKSIGVESSIVITSWSLPLKSGVFKPDVSGPPEVHVGQKVFVSADIWIWRTKAKTWFLNCTVLKKVQGSPTEFQRVGRAILNLTRWETRCWRGKTVNIRIV